jgi:hypothetical protein
MTAGRKSRWPSAPLEAGEPGSAPGVAADTAGVTMRLSTSVKTLASNFMFMGDFLCCGPGDRQRWGRLPVLAAKRWV